MMTSSKSPFTTEETGAAFGARITPAFAAIMHAAPLQDTPRYLIPPPDLASASDSGDANDDNLTNARDLLFSGEAQAYEFVDLYSRQGISSGTLFLGAVQADANGHWQIRVSQVPDGVQDIFYELADRYPAVTSAALHLSVKRGMIAVSTPDLSTDADSGSSQSDNQTNAETLVLSGSGDPGAKLELWDGAVLAASSQVANDGLWSVRLPQVAAGQHQFSAITRDAAGNSSNSGVLPVHVDRSIAAPSLDLDEASDSGWSKTDNITSMRVLNLSGVGEANAVLTLSDGATLLGSTRVDNNGVWHFSTPSLNDGLHDLSVSASDAAGNISTPTRLQVTVDNHYPIYSMPALLSSDDTGISNTDRITNINTPTFSGKTEPGAHVSLSADRQIVGSTFANANGDWRITSSQLADGNYTFGTVTTSAAGLGYGIFPLVPVTIDSTISVSSPDLQAVSDSGAANNDNVTNLNTPTFSGKAEALALVALYDNGSMLGQTNADANGDWSFTSGPLAQGEHSINSRASDRAGNLTPFSTPLKILLDVTPASIPTFRLAASSDRGTSNKDGITNASSLLFDGSSDAYDTITLYENNLKLGSTKADANGQWSITLPSFSEGTHVLSAKAVDTAGNASLQAGTFAIQLDYQLPALATPVLLSDSGASNSDRITNTRQALFAGSAEAGATIRLLRSDQTELGRTTADTKGQWSLISSNLSDGKQSVYLEQSDVAGNQNKSALISFVVDTLSPTQSNPRLRVIDDSSYGQPGGNLDNITSINNPRLNGNAEAGSKIMVLDNGTLLGQTMADSNGFWELTCNPLTSGLHPIQTYALDVAGNKSSLSNVLNLNIDVTIDRPARPDLLAVSDNGDSDTDNLTNITTPLLGGVVEANAKVTIYESSGINLPRVLGETVADAKGNWLLQSSELKHGLHKITTRVTDPAGNYSDLSPELLLDIDTSRPINAPAQPMLMRSSDSGASNSDLITKLTRPEFYGKAEPGLRLELFDGKQSLGWTKVADNGYWQLSSQQTLSDGLHQISAVTKYAAGGSSPLSTTLNLSIDSKAPPISAMQLAEDTDSGVKGDFITSNLRPRLQGQTEAGAQVLLRLNSEDGKILGQTKAGADGNWKITLDATYDSSYVLFAQSVDLAGNVATADSRTLLISKSAPALAGIAELPLARLADNSTDASRWMPGVGNADGDGLAALAMADGVNITLTGVVL